MWEGFYFFLGIVFCLLIMFMRWAISVIFTEKCRTCSKDIDTFSSDFCSETFEDKLFGKRVTRYYHLTCAKVKKNENIHCEVCNKNVSLNSDYVTHRRNGVSYYFHRDCSKSSSLVRQQILEGKMHADAEKKNQTTEQARRDDIMQSMARGADPSIVLLKIKRLVENSTNRKDTLEYISNVVLKKVVEDDTLFNLYAIDLTKGIAPILQSK